MESLCFCCWQVLFFSPGENWKVMRRFTISTLRDFGMGKRAIEDQIVEECGYLIENLEFRKGKPFETITIINGAVANIIVSVLLGKLLGSPSVAIYNLCPALGFVFKNYKTVLQNRDDFLAFIQVIFKEHLKKLDKNDQRSLIDVFFVRQKEEKSGTNSYFHNENLKNLVLNLFTAGMETTSTTLHWGLLLMMKYPEIQQKVQNEIATVLGSNLPCGEHRTKIPYTSAVVHEILRFANIVSMNGPHSTTMDVTLKGYFIPKGTYIIPFLGSVLQDKSQWEKPGDFYPEHFLDPEGKFVKKEAFMPFSAARSDDTKP
ncbi:hypothetical protein Y1Q_0012982 [Alligator mississippiensis]|uniref:Cytochrome P450 2K6-like n=1 Tax=Alligator mississippiensis TaxID=8496 RepID=A0A151NC62_ALLMI|nr:hypothetical protein Y1Q_0012982 [Alligator mississippiensis]